MYAALSKQDNNQVSDTEEKAIKVLLIEDNPDDAELLKRSLVRSENGKFTVKNVSRLIDGLELLAKEGADIVLTDLGLPDSQGLDTITRVLYQSKFTPVVVLSGLDDEVLAIKAVHMGAQDYLVKGQMEGTQLERALFYAIERSRLQKELEHYTQELGKTKNNLCKILEKNADAVIVVREDRHISFINPAAANLLKRTKKELLRKPFGFPLEAGKTTEIEIIHQGGEIRVAEMRVVDIEWEGEPAYLASLRDITERKEAERRIEKAAEEWRTTFDSINDWISIHDKDSRITRVNRSLARALNKEPREIIGKTCYELIHGMNTHIPNCPHLEVLKTKKPAKVEVHLDKWDIFAEISVSPILNNENEVIGSVHITKDITKRKLAEEKLRFSDAAFRSINESIIATDINFKITHWNQISEKIYGIKASQAIGQQLYKIIDIVESDTGENAARINKLETNGYIQEEQLHRTKHGEVWVDTRIQAIEGENKRFGWVVLSTAITQKKEAEDALKRSEEFSSSVLQNAPNPILVINPDSSINFVNPAFEKLTGFTAAELIGARPPYPWWPEEETANRATAFKEAMTGKGNRIERVSRKKNGDSFWAVINSEPIMIGGRLRYLLVNWVDITDLKQAEEAIRQSEENLKSYLDCAPDGVYITDSKGKLLYGNRMAEAITGYKKDELIGKNILKINLLQKRSLPKAARLLARSALGRPTGPDELYLKRKDGSQLWVEISTTPVHRNGELQIIGFVRDITERKKSEEALKHSEEFSSSLMEGSAVPILVINSDTSVRYINPAMEKLAGFSSREIIGKKAPYPWWTENPESGRIDEFKKDIFTGVHGLDKLFWRKSGEAFWVEITSVPVKRNGKYQYSLENWLDITERKKAEEKLRQIDQMKSEFLSNVSHELRTPLQSINGFIKLLLRGQVPDAETQKEFLSIIDRENQYLSNLIDSLLDMSRLESGRFEINKQVIPVKNVFIDALKIFRGMARDKNITLKEDIPDNLPEIEADGERIRQVVINLVGNALKFSDPDKSITVMADTWSSELFFRVTDEGIGIPREAMLHLFERFYRAEDKLVRGGAGLGLYISKQIIESHGGSIWAESRLGEGSSFSFTLPLNGKGGNNHG